MSGKPRYPVVLMTDFGPQSSYVGQMKLVMERVAPGIHIVDLAHDLPAQDLRAAALILRGSGRFFPESCVVSAVIDPGVGSERRILAASFHSGLRIVLPDNGLFSSFRSFGKPQEIREVSPILSRKTPVSPVFHGRDIFAPAAAHLALGLPLNELGPPFPGQPMEIEWPEPEDKPGMVSGEILYVDPFGNCVTNINESHLDELAQVFHSGQRIPLGTHYAEAEEGKPLALIGSFGYLEISVRNGSAAETLGMAPGTAIEVRKGPAGRRPKIV